LRVHDSHRVLKVIVSSSAREDGVHERSPLIVGERLAVCDFADMLSVSALGPDLDARTKQEERSSNTPAKPRALSPSLNLAGQYAQP
jgi:hypothetical protein